MVRFINFLIKKNNYKIQELIIQKNLKKLIFKNILNELNLIKLDLNKEKIHYLKL